MKEQAQMTPPRFNSGDAIQIGTGMGLVMMMSGTHLIDAVIVGIATGLSIFGIVTIIRRIRG
jgi:hypothetical protein